MDSKLNQLVGQIRQGDKQALEEFVVLIQNKVYGLALRMLYDPADAEDAAQEILIKVIVHLDSFRGESKPTTWVYRIAANHLLNARKTRAQRQEISFDAVAARMDEMEARAWNDSEAEAFQGVLLDQTRFSCMQGFQQCLDRDHRMAFVLGAVMDMNSAQAAYILDISPAAFRKRLSRARARLHEFMSSRCGLINPANACRCAKAASMTRDTDPIDLDPKAPIRTRNKSEEKLLMQSLQELDEMGRMSALFKSYSDLTAPQGFVEDLKSMIAANRFNLLAGS